MRADSAEDRARLMQDARRLKIYPSPRPGHGTVWIMPPHHDDVWRASWQDDGNRTSDVEGSFLQIRDWVDEQPAAAKVIFIAALNRHIDVDDDSWARARRPLGRS
jgi:hypothetical protein